MPTKPINLVYRSVVNCNQDYLQVHEEEVSEVSYGVFETWSMSSEKKQLHFFGCFCADNVWFKVIDPKVFTVIFSCPHYVASQVNNFHTYFITTLF